jgi:hypothetical protein
VEYWVIEEKHVGHLRCCERDIVDCCWPLSYDQVTVESQQTFEKIPGG